MIKSSELQPRSDALANRNFNNVKQSARATGSLLKARTFSKNLSKPESPAEDEYVLSQWSPSSDTSFGWQEVPAHSCISSSCSSSESEGVHSHSLLASASTDSNQQINVTSEDRHFNESIEGKEERSLGVTATNKVNLREDKERLAKSTHLAKKKTRDVPKMKYWSGSSDDSELPSLLKEVKVRNGLKIEDLTEEEEIWMVQCPPSLNPQDLKNQDLVFGGASAFPLEIEDVGNYETVSYVRGFKPVSCLLPSKETGSLQAKVLEPKGLMIIMEKVDVPEVKLTPTIPRNFETPKGLRVRHPLFGSDYKEELEVRTQLASQHRKMLREDLLMQPKTKKEKKKKGRDQDTRNDSPELQIRDKRKQESHNNEDRTKKNKKKHHKEHKKKKTSM